MQKIKQYWKNKHILSYFEVSAKDNTNIEFAFEKIVNLKYERFNEINKNEDAIINVYVRKMSEYSSELFKRHHLYDLDKNNSEIFARFCKGKNHCISLDYFYRSHNVLSWAACISKFKTNENGKHKKCKIRSVQKIKKNKLNENVKWLEELTKVIEQPINELKKLSEIIYQKKKKISKKIQNFFTS